MPPDVKHVFKQHSIQWTTQSCEWLYIESYCVADVTKLNVLLYRYKTCNLHWHNFTRFNRQSPEICFYNQDDETFGRQKKCLGLAYFKGFLNTSPNIKTEVPFLPPVPQPLIIQQWNNTRRLYQEQNIKHGQKKKKKKSERAPGISSWAAIKHWLLTQQTGLNQSWCGRCGSSHRWFSRFSHRQKNRK